MAFRARFEAALISGLLLGALSAGAQETTPAGVSAVPPAATPAAPAPAPAATTPAPATAPSAPASPTPAPSVSGSAPLRLTDPGSVRIERLPSENPFGVATESPAALPAKPVFT